MRNLLARIAFSAFALALGFNLSGCGLAERIGLRPARQFNYLVGRGWSDITGPAADVGMFGYARAGQTTAGIHTRLRARAFIIAERGDPADRVAFVVCDLGAMFHEIQQAVVANMQTAHGDLYRLDNVVLTATHTHSGPAGYSNYMAKTPLGGAMHRVHMDAIIDGITDALMQAHADLAPGYLVLGQGEVEDAGAQRSMPAYLANPEAERARYDAPTDKTMTLVKFVRADGPVAALNWFAVHPTSMTYDNQLISGDHKGYAEAAIEESLKAGDGKRFVAAFANTNCGDVTSNLNLDNTGPGVDEFDSTRIIGERQQEVALTLLDMASARIEGGIETRFAYVDFSSLVVGDEFTGAGEQGTCPSAYGYAFAAGSTEDGGGHPLFREGKMVRNRMADSLVASLAGFSPSDDLRACHAPKIVLLGLGEATPQALQAQVLPLTLMRIGSLAIICIPGEITTMAGRRLREAVAASLAEGGVEIDTVVIAAYSNDYAGYITTREEYETQQYEGGHTLYGPWTHAGYMQEFTRLADAMASGEEVDRGPDPFDISDLVQDTPLGTDYDETPPGAQFGEVIADADAEYQSGRRVSVTFWTANPSNAFETGSNYVAIERKEGEDWRAIASDADWSTRFGWARIEEDSLSSQAAITWDIPIGTSPGTYRIVHFGKAKSEEGGTLLEFSGASREFEIVGGQ